MDNKLIKKTSSGVAWNYLERLLAQGINLLVTIILSRLIAPEFFGAISIATIMINICNIFISNGFANSLIQAKEVDTPMYNAIFYYGFISSILLYLLIYFLSPIVSNFYDLQILTPVLRFMGLRIPIASINAVQHAYLVRRLEFKKFFMATLSSAVVSAIVGIGMAYGGYGIWALATQFLTSSIIDTIVLLFVCNWRPGREVAWIKSLKLFSFGTKMLVAALIKNIYSEISGLIVGKRFSVKDLAYYTKGKQFPNIIVTNLNSSLSRVLFSTMSKFQDEQKRIKAMLRRSLKINVYIVVPLMVGMFACSTPIIRLLLTDSWSGSIPYLRLFCIVFLLKSIQNVYFQAFNSLGKSGLTLKIEVFSTVFGVATLLFAVFVLKNIYLVVVAMCLECLLSVVLCCFFSRKLLAYSLREQGKDLMPVMLIGALMGIIVWGVGYLIHNLFIRLLLQIFIGVLVYVLFSKLFKIDSFGYLLKIIQNMVFKKRGKLHDENT